MAEEHQQDPHHAGSGSDAGPGTRPEPQAGEPRSKSARDGERFVHPLGNARELMGAGFEILASIVGLGLAGYLIDYFAGTAYWGMTIGLILGIIGGLYNAVKKAFNITGISPYEKKRTYNNHNDESQRGR